MRYIVFNHIYQEEVWDYSSDNNPNRPSDYLFFIDNYHEWIAIDFAVVLLFRIIKGYATIEEYVALKPWGTQAKCYE